MIAGNTSKDFVRDFIYNASPESLQKIENGLAKLAHESKNNPNQDQKRKASWMHHLMSDSGLANFYNAMKNGVVNDGFETDIKGEKNEVNPYLPEAIKDMDALARIFANEDMDVFDKMGKAIEMYTSVLGSPTSKEKEMEQSRMQRIRETCEEENIKYGAEIHPEKEVSPKFKQLKEWLDSFQTTSSKKKVFKQMEKMSDIQKVSAVEFAKPRMMFMKKLVNKEFWFRGEKPQERYLHCITDFSGSMGEFMGERNTTWQMLFDTCQKANIVIENTMFNCGLEKHKPTKWDNQAVLDSQFKLTPDGGDNLGRATIDKLKMLTRKREKQYLVAISDGTGSFDSDSTSETAKKLALEKNVELKFVLFSRQNSMYTINPDDIFYIFEVNDSKTEIKKGYGGILEAITS